MVARSNLGLAEKYRPASFDGKFFDKQDAVRFLRNEALKPHGGRSVLIDGPDGCGKTMLAQFYAKALICESATNKPCDSCPSCDQFERGTSPNIFVAEHDGNDERFAHTVNEDARSDVIGNGRAVILIDKLELVSKRGLELLHERVVRPPEGVTFICCARDKRCVGDAFAEALFSLQVERPSLSSGMEYVRWLCGQSSINAEDGAIERIARAGGLSFRRLAFLAETLEVNGELRAEHVDIKLHGKSFVSQYLDAAFVRRPIGQQLCIIAEWTETPSAKVDAIGLRVMALSRGSMVPEPADGGLSESEAAVVAGFNDYVRRGGASFLREAMRIWLPAFPCNELALQLKLFEFDSLIVAHSLVLATPQDMAQTARAHRRKIRTTQKELEKRAFVSQPSRKSGLGEVHFTVSQIGKLWNAASFMVQYYGSLMNARLTIRHSALQFGTVSPAVLITELNREIRLRFKDQSGMTAALHWLYRHRVDESGDLLTEYIISLDARRSADIERWIVSNFLKARGHDTLTEGAVEFECLQEERPVQTHRSLVRWMCAAVRPDFAGYALMARLGIKPEDNVPLGDQRTERRYGLSRGLDTHCQNKADEDLPVLGAFDMTHIDSEEWELNEFRYRQQIQRDREKLRADFQKAHPAGNWNKQFERQWQLTKPTRHAQRPRQR